MADEIKNAKKASKKASAAKKVTKKAAKKAPAARKVTKKAAKKKVVAKKVARKTTKKVAKKVSKPVTKKATKKVVKKAAKKTAAKKVSKKATKKATKQPQSDTKLEQLQDLLQENLSGLSTDKAEAVARNIWLAGLGAYSKTFEEVVERREEIQDRFEAINTEGLKLFDELIKRGKELQDDAEEAASKVAQQGRETIEDRVEEFKQRFGGGLSSFGDITGRLRDAVEKIEEIGNRLQKKDK